MHLTIIEYNHFVWMRCVFIGEPNCVDASDEINCRAPVCAFGACSQICLEKKSGNYNCRCADGYSKDIDKNSTCVSNEEPLLLFASDKDIRFLLPLKQFDSKVHGSMPVSQNKIDVFDVHIMSDSMHLYWIASPNRTIQMLATTTFNGNFKWKVKREIMAVQEEKTIVSTLRLFLRNFEIDDVTVISNGM